MSLIGALARTARNRTIIQSCSTHGFQLRSGGRGFSCLYPRWKDVTRTQSPEGDPLKLAASRADSIKPESIQKPLPAVVDTSAPAKNNATANDPLLSEKTVSNKEQRKVDLAIMKEMSKYLWPKDNLGTRFRVGLSVGLLIGAKVCEQTFPVRFVCRLIYCIVAQCSNPILL